MDRDPIEPYSGDIHNQCDINWNDDIPQFSVYDSDMFHITEYNLTEENLIFIRDWANKHLETIRGKQLCGIV